jgi:hypothetical protein
MLLAKFHRIPSPQEFSIKISLISTHRSFSKFKLKTPFESEKILIRKVVPYLKYFQAIVYFKFLEQGKIFFAINKI